MSVFGIDYESVGGGIDLSSPIGYYTGNTSKNTWYSVATTKKPKLISWTIADGSNNGNIQILVIDVENEIIINTYYWSGAYISGGYRVISSPMSSWIRNVTDNGFEFKNYLDANTASHDLLLVYG